MKSLKCLLIVLLAALVVVKPSSLLQSALGQESEDYDGEPGLQEPEDDYDDPDAMDYEGIEDEEFADNGYGEDEVNQDLDPDNDDAAEGEGDEEDFGDDDEEEEELEDAGIPLGDDGDVVGLNALNFKDAIKITKYILVEFYAPWCGHCKDLAPEYRKAATELKAVNITLAKIDGTRETELAEDYGVEGFPTIYFFVNGSPRKFSGGRRSDEIVDWVLRKLGPAVETLEDREAAEKVLTERSVICAAYFDKFEGAEFDAYHETAVDDDIYYVQTSSLEIASMFGFDASSDKPALALLKDEELRYVLYSGDFSKNSLLEWYSANKLPLVITFSDDTSSQIFGSELKKQVLLFATSEKYEELIVPFQAAAMDVREILFVHINTSDFEASSGIVEFFSVGENETVVFGFDIDKEGRKFRMDLPITEENVKAFAEDLHNDKARPFLKSAPPPEKNDGDVKVVVGTTFDEIVMDETKDVLLEVYAPWCGHCKTLAPVYARLGKRFSTVDSVVIAKMDGTINEHPDAKVEGFPTVLLFPAGEKKGLDPIVVEERNLRGLSKFIKTNARIPYELKKISKVEEKSAEELGEEAELQSGEAKDAGESKDEL